LIPKVIHYCWFGGNPKSKLIEKCIKSWKKYCPDYEIIEWNEENFDINFNQYTKEAYEAKKWAFVSDVARLWVLVEHGGVYMDTDCELVKPIDKFLAHEAFSGFESPEVVPTAIMASKKGYPLFQEFLNEYEDKSFKMPDGTYNETPNVTYMTNTMTGYGLRLDDSEQTIKGFTLYPAEYFCPWGCPVLSKELRPSKNTYAIHHFNASWVDEETRKRRKKRHFLTKWLGVRFGTKVFNTSEVFRESGAKGVLKKLRKSE